MLYLLYYLSESGCAFHRAKAKKRKTGELPSTSEKPGSETPELVTPEGQVETAKDQADEIVEPPPQNKPPSTGKVDTQTCVTDEVGDINPPNPDCASSPTKAAENVVVSSPQAADKVTITGASFKAPKPSTALAKHALPSLEELSAADLHEAYLTRLSTSRDMEASMVNMLKRKYEVRKHLFSTLYIPYVAAKDRVVMHITSWCLNFVF